MNLIQNRLKWAKYLQEPERLKGTGRLEIGGEQRCCLGHGCACFELPRIVTSNGAIWYEESTGLAPQNLVKLVGLRDDKGNFINSYRNRNSLAGLNDYTGITPQEIGKLIETEWLNGGPDTPFLTQEEYDGLSKSQTTDSK